MTRTMKFSSILVLLLVFVGGCSSADAQCAGGRCASVGFWSPWIGGWYYASPCASGRCRTAAKPAAEPEEPAPLPESTDSALTVDNDGAADVHVEFKPFCLRVAELVNAQRKALGLSALELDETLCAGCDSHSRYMASYGFVHAYGIGARECIASGAASPESVVNMWLNSSGHRAILLGPGRIVGIGRSGSFWTLRVR